MQERGTIPFRQGVAKVVSGGDLQGYSAWPRAFRDKYKDHRFFEIIGQTLAQDFEYRYLVLEDKSGEARAIQPVFFVRQNLVEGVPGKIRSIVDLVRKQFPRFLTMRILMVGCAIGEGNLGACRPEDEQWTAEALLAILKIYARQNKASLVVLKDFPAKYRYVLGIFSANGYARVPSMPMTRLALGYRNFDEYLSALSYATRKNLRRKFRRTERAAKIDMEVVCDITPYVEEIYPLYLQVHERSRLKFETLTKDFFCTLGERMPERARFFIWRQLGRIVAFSCCLIHDGTIYDECLGLDYKVAFDLHLYFYLDLYVMHTSAFFNPIFRRVLKYLEPTRHDPILRRFPNADQL